MNNEAPIADAGAPTVDGPVVSTDVQDPVRTEPEAVGGEADTFAAAIGLTPPVQPKSRRIGKRRDGPDAATGRPLVTAESATAAANFVGTVQPGIAKSPEIGPATQQRPQQAPGPQQLGSVIDPQTPTVPGSGPVVGVTPVSALPEKVSFIQRRRMRARRVRRTIRHVDPWSVFKISILLFACLYIATMAAGVLLWNAAVGSGIIDRFESFMQDLGFETWELVGEEIFRGASVIGLVLVAAASALSVVMAILFNLISDLTGGVRVTVIEEDLGRKART